MAPRLGPNLVLFLVIVALCALALGMAIYFEAMD
jgi:hypothetical protein